jgi:rRNA maturation RNase YbeY
MKIDINNLQRTCRPNIPRIRKLIRGLMRKAQTLDRAARWSEISVVLFDNRQIRDINAQLLDIDEVTDVISLRYAAVPGDGTNLTGEIYVNVQRAAERRRAPWNASRELALYLAHGCDHLMNSRDDTGAGYRRMRRRELKWLREKDISTLAGKIL